MLDIEAKGEIEESIQNTLTKLLHSFKLLIGFNLIKGENKFNKNLANSIFKVVAFMW